MIEMTGLSFDRNINVYITHPALKQGRNEKGNIYWSYQNKFPNYNTVYLWHETFHCIVDEHGGSELSHAINELVTDHELRKRLNGTEYPPFIGHQGLHELQEKLLPDWQNYLTSRNKNILTFIDEERKKLA